MEQKRTREELVLVLSTTTPLSPREWEVYYMENNHWALLSWHYYWYDKTAFVDLWKDINWITRSANAWASWELIVSAWANKTAQSFTSNWLLKVASWVVASAVEWTDYLTGSSTNTLTNKTIDAEWTWNSITNLKTSNLKTWVLNTSITSWALDTEIPSALAVYNYVVSKVAWLLDYRWGFNASAWFPTTWWSGTAWAIAKWDVFVCTTWWTISWEVFEIWDVIIANIDVASVSADWDSIQVNLNMTWKASFASISITTDWLWTTKNVPHLLWNVDAEIIKLRKTNWDTIKLVETNIDWNNILLTSELWNIPAWTWKAKVVW